MATTTELMSLFGITKPTAKRWIKGSLPDYAVERLALRDGTHPDWFGLRLMDGYIITPAGDRVEAKEIEWMRWLVQNLSQEIGRAREYERKFKSYESLSVAANEPCNYVMLGKLL